MSDTLAIELWPVEDLVPYERNAKNHPADQVKRLAATIARFGWDQPIVVDADGVIIKGHGRRLAALQLKLDRVPVLVRRDLSKEQADAVRISDNAVVSLSYDTKLMQDELQRIMAAEIDFSIDDLGLSAKEHDLLLRQIDIANEDVLIDDTSVEIAKQKTEEEEKVERADREEMPIGEAFGFKKISRAESRLIQRLMAKAEEDTGKEGREALIGWMELMIEGGAL